MKRWSGIFLVCAICLVARPIAAEWVRATGNAVVNNGDVIEARNAAREDAIYQASLQLGAEVSSRERMEMGLLTESTVDVRSRASVRDLVVVREQVSDGVVELVVDADIYAGTQCDSTISNSYRKQVGVLGFILQNRDHANIGGLFHVERKLPATLTQFLIKADSVLPRAANHIQLYSNILNAPTRETQQRTLSSAIDEARELGVQFVVSGIIRSMAMVDEKSLSNSLLSRSMRAFNLLEPRRRFVVDLFIHDGFSGDILFEKQYATSGKWEVERSAVTEFMSPAFKSNEYGQNVWLQLQQMARDIQSTVNCQPFMTRITKIEEQEIQFASGAHAGIRPGDKFQLYRSRQLYKGVQFQGTLLTTVRRVVQVNHVQPGFSTGKLTLDPTRLNIQEDDVLVSW